MQWYWEKPQRFQGHVRPLYKVPLSQHFNHTCHICMWYIDLIFEATNCETIFIVFCAHILKTNTITNTKYILNEMFYRLWQNSNCLHLIRYSDPKIRLFVPIVLQWVKKGVHSLLSISFYSFIYVWNLHKKLWKSKS